jgi:hypothetical protein
LSTIPDFFLDKVFFMEITAECERKAGAWRVRVPALDNLLISTKRLDLATEQIKDLVHEYQGVDRDARNYVRSRIRPPQDA